MQNDALDNNFSSKPLQFSRSETHWEDRFNQEQKMRRNDHRDGYGRDRARILHSAAFRRLQAKTQVHSSGDSDFYRTRLTHSLEAAQIGSGILSQIRRKQPQYASLLPTDCLMEALCLAHDIGHPPFGHGGEIALNYLLRNHGGFEGNAQTFRIVTHLEPYTLKDGMNLTRRCLLGLLKYPAYLSQLTRNLKDSAIKSNKQLKVSDWYPAKGIYDIDHETFEWVLQVFSQEDKHKFTQSFISPPIDACTNLHLKTAFKSLDCSIMELADDIAYGVHDLEDAIVMGLVHYKDWQNEAMPQLSNCGDPWIEKNIKKLSDKLFSNKHHERKDAIGGIVNALLTSIDIRLVTGLNTSPHLKQISGAQLSLDTGADHQFEHPLLAYNAYLSPSMDIALQIFKQFVWRYVIRRHDVQLIEYKGQQIILDLFEAFESDPLRLLPQPVGLLWQQAKNEDSKFRVIADYVSAMTDSHAQKMHKMLFS